MAGPSSNPTVGEIMNAGQRVFRQHWTLDAKAVVRCHARRLVKALRGYANAIKSGQPGRLRRAQFMVEHSFSARLCAMLLNFPKTASAAGGKGAKPLTLSDAMTLAEKVVTRQASGEKVRVRLWEKPEGGTRTICSFGPRARAANYIGDLFLAARWGENPMEYSRRGRGRDAAIREALLAYKNRGVRRFVHVDVKDCFGSIQLQDVPGISVLPKAMLQNCLRIACEADIEISNSTSHNAPSPTAVCTGLPQGLRSSARVASHVLRAACADLALPLTISHGDDVLLGVKKGKDGEAAKSALVSALAGHPAGPLLTKQADLFGLKDEHDYLGYRLLHRWKFFGGWARARASKKAIRRFQRRTARKLALIVGPQQLLALDDLARRWARSFGAWAQWAAGAEAAITGFILDVMPIIDGFQKWLKVNGPTELHVAKAKFDADYLPLVGKPWAC